jgi:SAM-dependent methyltransferase
MSTGTGRMKATKLILVSALAVTSFAHCFGDKEESEKKAIEAVIREAYIGGAYNDDDTRAIRSGFHEALTIHDLHGQSLRVYSLRQWLMQLDHMKQLRPDWNDRTTAEITVLALAGNAAVARVDVRNDEILEVTDFLSLYKFADGWKVTDRIFTRHPLPDEVHNRRIEEWENRINEVWNPPDKVIEAIGVKPGMVIGEVGAGRGRYTVPLARRVGDEGKIYANDVSEDALSVIRERCRRNGISNVETILGERDDPLLPERALDMVLIVWVLHHLEKPVPLLEKLKRSLRAGAPVILVEPKDSEVDMEREAYGEKIDPSRPTMRERIETAAEKAGFELKLIRMERFLPRDDIYVLEAKSDS